jgi:bifunctional DNA-binding transcriptional regulator/antitoxin component of YhaV-PrlF toxin-antitoxin module
MPRIAKGAKYIFGWSRIGEDGRTVIPGEAFDEYGLKADEAVILTSGSRTSGGFGITSKRLLEGSRLRVILEANPGLADSSGADGQAVRSRGRVYCRLPLDDRSFRLTAGAMEGFGVKTGDRLLSIRSSDIAIGMAVKGPLIERAEKHPEIKDF